MINKQKWLESLTKVNHNFKEGTGQIDHARWLNSVPKRTTYNSVKKYSLVTVLFICGLFFVSALKNETRSLQKEISSLQASIDSIKFEVTQAILDNEVISSPENISQLAKKYLSNDFSSYKKSQIKELNEENINKTIILKKENNNNKVNMKFIKNKIVKKIEQKKENVKNIYNSPKDAISSAKAQRWAAVQLVKAFLGMPIIPGR